MALLTPLRPGDAPAFSVSRAALARVRGAGDVHPAGDAPIDHLLEPASMRDGGMAAATLAEPALNGAVVARPSADAPTGRLARVFHEEFHGLHMRLLLMRLLLWPLPVHVGGRLRALALKLTGFRVGYGTIFAGLPGFSGGRDMYRNLRIGDHCWFNVGCFFDLGATISVGQNVSFGHQVVVLTSSHVIGPSSRRASGLRCQPVAIGNGAWIGARCTILPGVRIGDGAIVAAGAVVHEDVPPDTLVAGVPARVVKQLG